MADKRTTTQAPASGAPRPLAIDEGHILRAQRGDRIATAVLTGIACFVMLIVVSMAVSYTHLTLPTTPYV